MLKKLDFYIIKKFLGTFFFAIALLIVVVIVFDVSENIDDFLERDATFEQVVFDYYFNFIPYFFNLFSPLFCFIAVIFFTSKMAARTEIVAMLSSGISFWRLLRPYIVAALVLSALSYYLANFLIPVTNRTLVDFQNTILRNPKNERKNNIHLQTAKGVFIYMETFNRQTQIGHKFTIEKFGEEGITSKLKAEVIRWDTLQDVWTLENYHIRTIKGHSEHIKEGNVLDTTLNFKPGDLVVEFDDIMLMNYSQLRDFIENERLRGNEKVAEYEIEKHRRTASPFSTFILTFIGMALSSRKSRGGIGWHLVAGISISFLYILFMQISTTFGVHGSLSPAMAVWFPNILFGVLAIYLLWKAPK